MISLKTRNWEIKNIDTVLFDKDGTFIDLHYFWGKMTELRVKEIRKKYNLKNEYFKPLALCLGYDIEKGKMLSDGITALYSRSKIIEIFQSDLKNFSVNISKTELENIFDDVSLEFYKNMQEYTKPINDAITFIKLLKNKGVKLGIVTSDSVQSTLLTLKHFNWEHLFDVTIGRESSSETKESGVPTKKALADSGSNAKNAIMIGDAPMDYISAKNAGIDYTILVSTGQLTTDELKKTSDFVVNSLAEIQIEEQ